MFYLKEVKLRDLHQSNELNYFSMVQQFLSYVVYTFVRLNSHIVRTPPEPCLTSGRISLTLGIYIL